MSMKLKIVLEVKTIFININWNKIHLLCDNFQEYLHLQGMLKVHVEVTNVPQIMTFSIFDIW